MGRLTQLLGAKTVSFLFIVVSNQRCVAKGLVTAAEVDAIYHRIRMELTTAGAIIDAAVLLPAGKDAAVYCRKPTPGIPLSAAREHQIDRSSSWMIGDSCNDAAAGKSAGCWTALLLEGKATTDCVPDFGRPIAA